MNKLSSKHYLFFICTVSFIGLRSYSSIFISMGGADTWLAGLIAGAIYLAYLYFIIYVCRKTNNFDIKDIFKRAYPKWLSSILIFIFAFTLFLTSIESAGAQSDSIHSNIFIETPIWYTLLFFIIPAAYLITRRLETLLIVILVTIVLVFSTMFIVELFTLHYQHYTYLLPVMALGINKEFILCILLILGAFSSTAVTFPFLKYVEKKEKLSKFAIIGGLIIIFISIASVVSAVTTFGPLRSSNICYPEFLRVQRIQIKGFIEFGDLLFISKTTCLWFLKYVICAVAILYLYKDKFTNKKIYAVTYSIVAYICTFFIARNHYMLFDYLRYYQLVALALLGIMPFITFSIYYFKFKKNLKAQTSGNGNNSGTNNISNNKNAQNKNNNSNNQDNLNNQNSSNTQGNISNQGNLNTQGNTSNKNNSNTQGNTSNQDNSNNQGNSNNIQNSNNQNSQNQNGANNSNNQDESNGSYVFGNYNESQNNNQNNTANQSNQVNQVNNNNNTNGNENSSNKSTTSNVNTDFAQSNLSGDFFFPAGTDSKN